MDKIKRFITCHIPVYACNFRCSYCYVGQHQGAYKNGIKSLYTQNMDKIRSDLSISRLGGVCYFNLCGDGETMLHPQLIPLVYELTKEGHYCDVITNGVLSDKIEELIAILDENQRKHLFLKFSFHYLQLKERNLLETFVSNVNKAKRAGVSFTVEITPHDELIPYIDEIKNVSLKNFGVLPHITVARNEATKKIELLSKYSRENYKNIWSVFDSELFDFKFSIFNERRCEFCYAGQNSLYVNLENGDYYQCYEGDWLGNIGNDKKLKFRPIGKCRLPHCFNGHAFLAFGDIPELNTPTYAEERDRVCKYGTAFLQPECRAFFSTKTSDDNKQYSNKEKNKIKLQSDILRIPRKIIKKIIFISR